MQRLPNVNPTDPKYTNGIGTFDIGAASEGCKILFYNESPLNIQLDFLNGSTDTLHAWEANYWVLDADTKQIEWELDADSLNVSTPPISIVFMTLYGPQERLGGTYPMALIRQASVGNLGGIATTTTNQLINDGNVLQEVLEATLSGHSSSDVIINNDGSYTLKGAGLLAAAGALTHILGTLTVDQAATLTGAVTAPGANVFGAAGVLTHILGTLTVDQAATFAAALNANGAGTGLAVAHNETVGGTLGVTGVTTHTGNVIANGGMNINTIRDNVNGNAAVDLSAGTGEVKFNLPIRIVPQVASLNGSTSGSFTIYEFCVGVGATDLKLCVCVSNNFRNGGGSVQSLALPSAFQSFARMWHGEISPATITNGGVTQNVGTIIGLPASNANTGAVSVGATIAAYTLDDCAGGFDTIKFNSGQATAHTGVSVWLGI